VVQHLLDSGEEQLTRLQYNQEMVTNTREVCWLLGEVSGGWVGGWGFVCGAEFHGGNPWQY
jgi:hypothetical protein